MDFKQQIIDELTERFAVSANDATDRQFYEAAVGITRGILQKKRAQSAKREKEQGAKKVYYMSMEFLIGRSLKNNLYNLGLETQMRDALRELGGDLDKLYEMEPDAGLGNGGLGRLASCYLDSLTGLNYPATGFSIRYEFGIFKQVIMDGWQVEYPDNWLELGGAWLVPRPDESEEVYFDGYVEENWSDSGLKTVHKDYTRVLAVPYDILISGNGDIVNKLRIWGAKSLDNFDMSLFSRGEYLKSVENEAQSEAISKVLYPADDHDTGKRLRLRQQYFFVSASLKNIIKEHLALYDSLDNLADKVVIHINDTHPALSIPELMRILMDEHGYSWDNAWNICTKTLAYTNHTVMSEALEQWNVAMFKSILPRIYSIVKEINRRFCEDVYANHPEKRACIDNIAIISHGMVKMANLCVACSFCVNGVSALHSEILKNDLFRDYNDIFPGKLTNVTNGIVHRRWLCQSNPRLTELLCETIGDGFIKDSMQLKKFLQFKDDSSVLQSLSDIKLENKRRLAGYIGKNCGISVSPDSIFDIQAKRLHEYKRQLLCALYILYLYRKLKNNEIKIKPHTFIFGAKASSGYVMAKEIIRFICAVSDTVNNDTQTNGFLKAVFLPDYRVSLAEIMMPAAELSEQISLAGKEASGTGNMKFMINGAITIGTLDGANVEIHEQVGDDNIFLFGLRTKEVNERLASYRPSDILNSSPELCDILKFVSDGGLCGKNFDSIVHYLKDSDPYMTLADFESYKQAQLRADKTYGERETWNRMSLVNIAKAGVFSSDRAVSEYASRIWGLRKI